MASHSDAEVFGKLSRIFETHGFANDDSALDDMLEDFDPAMDKSDSPQRSPGRKGHSSSRSAPNTDRQTPYQVWHEKNQKNFFKKKPPAKLNGQQWDRLVEKMHLSNRTKQSAMIKEQNEGLAAELEGFSFKPRINQTSLDLSATMKSLNTRIPEMIVEREKLLENKRKESAKQEMVECSFSPKRHGAKASDLYLKKSGRAKLTPEYLCNYDKERERRNDIRRQIVSEMEEREMTFTPQMSEKSIKLQEKLVEKGIIEVDPLTRQTLPTSPSPIGLVSGSKRRTGVGSMFGLEGGSLVLEEGPMLQIESEHPYRHNTNEYTTVSVPGAVSYCIRFDERTRTKPIYDFVKFYESETHTDYFGCGKYSGGTADTPCNWPGMGTRLALIIPASKFILHFKTNGSLSDWGFCMQIVPTLSSHIRQLQLETAGIPSISETGRRYQSPDTCPSRGAPYVPVHQRLYAAALAKSTDQHNSQVDLLQNKLNIALKPWESPRSKDGKHGAAHKFIRLNSSTHLPKNTISHMADSMVRSSAATGGGGAGDTGTSMDPPALAPTVIEFEDSMGTLWRQLRTL